MILLSEGTQSNTLRFLDRHSFYGPPNEMAGLETRVPSLLLLVRPRDSRGWFHSARHEQAELHHTTRGSQHRLVVGREVRDMGVGVRALAKCVLESI